MDCRPPHSRGALFHFLSPPRSPSSLGIVSHDGKPLKCISYLLFPRIILKIDFKLFLNRESRYVYVCVCERLKGGWAWAAVSPGPFHLQIPGDLLGCTCWGLRPASRSAPSPPSRVSVVCTPAPIVLGYLGMHAAVDLYCRLACLGEEKKQKTKNVSPT